MCGCLSCAPQLEIWPKTQAYALTGNRTSDPLVGRSLLNPLSHTSQAKKLRFLIEIMLKVKNLKKPEKFIVTLWTRHYLIL